MKKITTILTFTILILFQSCEILDECEDIACFTPPELFQFKLVDKITGENLFTNGKFDSSDIKIINIEDKSSVEFILINENNSIIIEINSIGWKTESIHYAIQIAAEKICDLYVNAERKDGDCCQYTEYQEIRIENSDYNSDKNSNFYTILVE